jgi:hypothetical protein
MQKISFERHRFSAEIIVDDPTYNHFDFHRHLINRPLLKNLRTSTFSGWKAATLKA